MKGKVYNARFYTFLFAFLLGIIGVIIHATMTGFDLLAPIEKESGMLAKIFFEIVISYISMMSVFTIINTRIWSKLYARRDYNKKEKIRRAYNKCLVGLENKEYVKVKFILDNILDKEKNLSHLSTNIRLMYKLSTNISLSDETLIG